MKPKNREINVFSMSVIDLFASAMGAFMILAIIALPFFSNTGSSPENVAKIRKELNQALDKQRETEDEKRAVETELAKEKAKPQTSFPIIDIVIALDTTGSMVDQVAGLKQEITQLANLLTKLSPDAAMGIVDFKDVCDGGVVNYMPLTKLDRNGLDKVRNFTQRIRPFSANCNNDWEEAIDIALRRSLAVSWRANAEARSVVVISDNGTPRGTEQTVLSEARSFASQREKNQISTVYVSTQNSNSSFLERLAVAGNGNFVTAGASFTATVLLALAD